MDFMKTETIKKLESLISKRQNRTPAEVVVQDVVAVKPGERVLIIANPATNSIAQDLYTASINAGANATLMFQPDKTSFDNANPEVIAAIGTNPDVCFSISNCKLGKDAQATANPYKTHEGTDYDHVFDYLLEYKRTMRAVWTPGITDDMMARTGAIDYKALQECCDKVCNDFLGVISAHVTSPGGTDLEIPLKNRNLMRDDGNFTAPGSGGNIPAGEVFISPVVGGTKAADGSEINGCEGVIVFDGSMTFADGDALLETPIKCKVEKGYVTEITGGAEAKRLSKTITEAENRSMQYEREKKLTKGMGAVYKKNARNIGELGIGLNPAARVTGNMLEDEKAFHTCHFAIGANYDNDAPSLIHLDGVVRNPTILVRYSNGSEKYILKDGILLW
ncbi:MAG: peptidase M17 [Treponema sp.]|nr:peptidase M17 [Treponema sp.]